MIGTGINDGYLGNYWNMQASGYAAGGVSFFSSLGGPYGNECLDVQDASTTPGTTLDTWECNQTIAQAWHVYLEPFNYSD